ncbi:hypothetical protein PR001_g24802 [Phytophthora rubi]|nr:hypothetical protein PR001_g24802 [Phytophthora rubi]
MGVSVTACDSPLALSSPQPGKGQAGSPRQWRPDTASDLCLCCGNDFSIAPSSPLPRVRGARVRRVLALLRATTGARLHGPRARVHALPRAGRGHARVHRLHAQPHPPRVGRRVQRVLGQRTAGRRRGGARLPRSRRAGAHVARQALQAAVPVLRAVRGRELAHGRRYHVQPHALRCAVAARARYFERLQKLCNLFVDNDETTARAINANVNAKHDHVDQWVRGAVNTKVLAYVHKIQENRQHLLVLLIVLTTLTKYALLKYVQLE